MSEPNDETEEYSDEMYQQLTNDRTKAAVAERTVGDADQLDDPRTAIRYVGTERGVDQFQVAFTNTQGFPLGKTNRSIQPENHIRDWLDKNDAEIVDAREEELFEPTASEDFVGVALETDGGAVAKADYPHDSWFDAIKSTSKQFEDENDDLEVLLEGSIGFHTFFVAEGSDPTRGVQTAIFQGLGDLIEEVHIDREIVEHRNGEVTPETVRKEVENQLDEHAYFSSEMREAIGARVEERVEKNLETVDMTDSENLGDYE